MEVVRKSILETRVQPEHFFGIHINYLTWEFCCLQELGRRNGNGVCAGSRMLWFSPNYLATCFVALHILLQLYFLDLKLHYFCWCLNLYYNRCLSLIISTQKIPPKQSIIENKKQTLCWSMRMESVRIWQTNMIGALKMKQKFISNNLKTALWNNCLYVKNCSFFSSPWDETKIKNCHFKLNLYSTLFVFIKGWLY